MIFLIEGNEKVPLVLGTPGGQISGLRMSPLHVAPLVLLYLWESPPAVMNLYLK